ncbi:MAG: homoserine kinase [Chloroflexi bacterium]|uniref:Homoserine kinase n=1 Tax=Candidatus Chlorohelix allophototropha TaxID=3003348 RepID=A0A8T7M3I7_9CHLR|nr:homoserine kinase [Chloroflexota bacterium]WJW66066.1 homoserine kinase [Chloroflexota bacterium L227-S17]
MRIRVKVPASSANLGCGFDAFGLALALYTDFIFESGTHEGEMLVVRGEGADKLLKERCKLVYDAIRVYEGYTGYKVPSFKLEIENRIPLGRGLGSSAAAIVGGLVGADALCRRAYGGINYPSTNQLVRLATEIEGHPDNVSAALLGGLTLAVSAPAAAAPYFGSNASDNEHEDTAPAEFKNIDGGPAWRNPLVVSLPTPANLTTVVFIPSFEMSTKEARAVLPPSVTMQDAAHNSSRAALFIAAFTAPGGKLEWLAEAMNDRLHQPYRGQIFPQLPALIDGAQRAGAYGAALSGAGSAVLAFTTRERVPQIHEAFLKTARELGLNGRTEQLEIALGGPLIGYEL